MVVETANMSRHELTHSLAISHFLVTVIIKESDRSIGSLQKFAFVDNGLDLI